MSDIGRPQTVAQKTRKGKRAWRKNVDISDLEARLQEQREEIIHHGKALTDLASEDLFLIDEEADEEVERKMKRANVKKLKSSEILENKSKVPALLSKVGKSQKKKKDNKIQGVEKKEMIHLLKLAGKVKGYDKTEERMAKEGIIRSEAYDVWGTKLEEELRYEKLPSPLKENSTVSYTHPLSVPKTLKEAPIKIRKQELIPHAGKSYNPSFDNWRNLIEQEFFKEKTKEDQRLTLEEYRDRIQYLIANYEDNEVIQEDDSENDESVLDGSDGDPEVTSGENESQDVTAKASETEFKLSINPATKLKIKTKAQRNKEQRYKEKQKLQAELKEIKLRIKELEKLPEILNDVDEKSKRTSEKAAGESKDERRLRLGKKKLGSKFEPIEGPLEVKLSNELSDSLRKLKPEGNLLYDQMKNLQSKGMIETRRINKGKKGKKKVTEKWSYKDFK